MGFDRDHKPRIVLLDDPDDLELLDNLLSMHWQVGEEGHNVRAGRLLAKLFPEIPREQKLLPDGEEAPAVTDVGAVLRSAEAALKQGHENVTGSFDHTVDAADSMWADPLRDVRSLMDAAGISRE